MAADYGQFGQMIATGTTLVAAVGSLFFLLKKRAKWEPAEEDVPKLAQSIAALVDAVALAWIWYFQQAQGPTARSSLLTIALWSVAVAVACAILYGLLVSVFTYDREVTISPRRVVRLKVVGGFFLRPEAKAAQRRENVTIQELFKGSAYNADKLWNRLNRSLAKSSFLLSYVGLVVSGTLALATAAMSLSLPTEPTAETNLTTATRAWIAEAKATKSNGTIIAGSPIPTALASAKVAFEAAWRNSGLKNRMAISPDEAKDALSYTVGVYRIQEQNEPVKTNALHWADEAISHFEERQDKPRLVEALLDKAAIILDLAQVRNTDKETFDGISKVGDALMARAVEIAAPEKKAEVYRFSSRFYYNLARPKSFRLSEAWDNNYLLLAYERAAGAYDAAPSDIRNANQLLRCAMKVSRNSPQDSEPEWGRKLRAAQVAMKSAWQVNDSKIQRDRLSPLNVLGTGTLEAVAREWKDLPPAQRTAAADGLLNELGNDALPKLREAEALLKNGELRIAYGFDIYYDIARTYAQRVVLIRPSNRSQASKEFEQVEINLSRAKENATAVQLDSASKDIERDLSFAALSGSERNRLRAALRGATK
jgi:hypothetical protein